MYLFFVNVVLPSHATCASFWFSRVPDRTRLTSSFGYATQLLGVNGRIVTVLERCSSAARVGEQCVKCSALYHRYQVR